MKKTNILFTAAVIIGAAIILCSLGAAAMTYGGNSTPDGKWVLADNDDITLFINGESVSGNSGVNNYFGKIAVGSNGKIKLDNIGSTLMAGPLDAMDAEQKYLKALGLSSQYKIGKDKLILFDTNGNELLTFIKDVRTPVGNWTIAGTDVTLSIKEDGTFSGQSYVNLYSGIWNSKDGIKFSEIASTLIAGTEEDMELEQELFEALNTTDNFILNDGVLSLLDAGGDVILTFESA